MADYFSKQLNLQVYFAHKHYIPIEASADVKRNFFGEKGGWGCGSLISEQAPLRNQAFTLLFYHFSWGAHLVINSIISDRIHKKIIFASAQDFLYFWNFPRFFDSSTQDFLYFWPQLISYTALVLTWLVDYFPDIIL